MKLRPSENTAPQPSGPRIVFVVPDYVPALGGTTTQTRLHAQEFARRGWDVTVLTRRIRGEPSRDTVDSIPVRRLGPPGRGRVAKGPVMACLWWWLLWRRRSISALSVIMDTDSALCAWAAGLRSSTLLTWVSGGDPTRRLTGWKGRIRLRLLRDCRQVALSQEMKAELIDLSVPDPAVVAVPVDLSRFRPPTPTERAHARSTIGVDDEPVVVFVGHLRKDKGVDQLVVASKILRDQGVRLTAILVGAPLESGDRAFVDRLTQYVRTNSLTDAVRFVGPQNDVLPYLWAGDLFCLPSQREGMPNVLLEAMACGLPCVAPPSAGGNVLLGEGAGSVPASNEASVIAAVISALLSHPASRESIRRLALDRVSEGHSIEHVIDQYEDILRALKRPSKAKQAVG